MGKNTEKRVDTVVNVVLTIIIQDHHCSNAIVDSDGGLRAAKYHKE